MALRYEYEYDRPATGYPVLSPKREVRASVASVRNFAQGDIGTPGARGENGTRVRVLLVIPD